MTAVRTAEGNLKLIEWRVSPSGGVMRVRDTGNLAGAATWIDIARVPGSPRYVTTLRTEGRRLLLISWDAAGQVIRRLADTGGAAGAATRMRIVAISSSVFVVACRTSEGDLKLISWRLHSNGRLTRLADSGSAAGRVGELAMARVPGTPNMVATSVTTSDGTLRLITWEVDSGSGAIRRLGDSGNAMGIGSAVQCAASPTGHMLVSCKTSSRRLRVIAFDVGSSGERVRRVSDSGDLAGVIGRNSLVGRPYGALSAVSTGAGTLRLIKWSVATDGAVTRFGDSGDQAGRVGLIGSVAIGALADAPLVTPVQDESGRLKLLSWDDTPRTGELDR